MNGTIRKAQPSDVPAIVEISEQKRLEYEQYQPFFGTKQQIRVKNISPG